MKRDDMNRLVSKELEHIPRGVVEQNLFRATYNMIRRHDLAENSATPATESLRRVLNKTERLFPNSRTSMTGHSSRFSSDVGNRLPTTLLGKLSKEVRKVPTVFPLTITAQKGILVSRPGCSCVATKQSNR